MMVVNLAVGFVTPPVGINLFVASSMTKIPVIRIAKVSLPFTILFAIGLVLIVILPTDLAVPDPLTSVSSSLGRKTLPTLPGQRLSAFLYMRDIAPLCCGNGSGGKLAHPVHNVVPKIFDHWPQGLPLGPAHEHGAVELRILQRQGTTS